MRWLGHLDPKSEDDLLLACRNMEVHAAGWGQNVALASGGATGGAIVLAFSGALASFLVVQYV